MTTYEQLQKIIIASNKSLLDLTFGCEVEVKKNKELKKIRILRRVGEQYVVYNSRNNRQYLKSISANKIIGHPITFRHVMMAMSKTAKVSKLVIDDYGVFWDMNTLSNSTLQKKKFNWNFQVNTLAEQSEETLKWLLEVLK